MWNLPVFMRLILSFATVAVTIRYNSQYCSQTFMLCYQKIQMTEHHEGFNYSRTDDCRLVNGLPANLVTPAQLNYFISTFGQAATNQMYFGLTYNITSLTWVWSDGSDFIAASPSDWYAGFPFEPTNRSCGVMGFTSSSYYIFNKECSHPFFAYSCQYNLATAICSGGRCFQEAKIGNLSWLEAKSVCRAMGAGYQLATLESSTIFSIIQSALDESKSYWVGLSDIAIQGVLRWEDDTLYKAGEYQWAGDASSNTKRCAYVMKNTTINLENCGTSGSDYNRYLICESGVNTSRCSSPNDGCNGNVYTSTDNLTEYCFASVSGVVSWSDAIATQCQANLHSTATIAQPFDAATYNYLTRTVAVGTVGWIGLSNIDDQGVYRWLDGRVLTLNGWLGLTASKQASSHVVYNGNVSSLELTGTFSSTLCRVKRNSICQITNATSTLLGYPNMLFKCNVGHYLTSNGKSSSILPCHCLNQTLDDMHGTCFPGECPALIIGNASVEYSTMLYTGSANVTCNFGYLMPNGTTNLFLTCDSQKNWIDNTSRLIYTSVGCYVVECPALTVSRATVQYSSMLYSGSANITCNLGYDLLDSTASMELICGSMKNWTDSNNIVYTSINCKAFECSDLIVSNASVQYSSKAFAGKANVTCIYGYEENVQLTCSYGRRWIDSSNQIYTNATCKVISCAEPTTKIGLNSQWTSLQFDSYLELTCQDGYKLADNSSAITMQCLINKTWIYLNDTTFSSYNEVSCKPVKCDEALQNIVNGSIASGNSSYLSARLLSCDPWYSLPDYTTSVNFTCTASGLWKINSSSLSAVSSLLTCQRANCSNPNITLSHGMIETVGAMSGDKSTLSCDDGYIFNQTNINVLQLQCATYGSWTIINSQLLPFDHIAHILCTKLSCGYPSFNLVNASFTVASYLYQAVGQIKCLSLQERLPHGGISVNISCSSNGTWTALEAYYNLSSSIACSVAECATPQVNISFASATATPFSAEITCEEGYEFQDKSNQRLLYCSPDAEWQSVGHHSINYTDLQCQKVNCSTPLLNLTNGQLNRENTLFLDTVSAVCDFGYEFSDHAITRQLIFSANCTWTFNGHSIAVDESWSCQKKSCPNISLQVFGATITETGTLYQDEIFVTCNSGRQFPEGDETRQIICNGNETWVSSHSTSFSNWNCSESPASQCDLPDFILIEATFTPTSNLVYDYATVICNPNHFFWDGGTYRVIQCFSTGLWRFPHLNLNATDMQEVLACRDSEFLKNLSLKFHSNSIAIYNQQSADFCTEAPYLENANREDDVREIGGYVTYNCYPGYFFPGGGATRTFVCLNGSIWSSVFEGCTASTCNTPSPIDPGTTLTPHSTSYLVDQTVMAQCASPGRLSNGHFLTYGVCVKANKWSTFWEQCTNNRCPPLPIVEMSSVVMYTSEVGVASALLECSIGHGRADASSYYSVECQSNLTWSSEAWKPCMVEICLPYPLPLYSKLNTTQAIYNTYVLVSCWEGFIFPDGNSSATIFCMDDGIWNYPALPDCMPIDCGNPSQIPGSETSLSSTNDTYIYSLSNSSSMTTYNATRSVTCLGKTRLSNGHVTYIQRCDNSRSWTPHLLNCLSTRCPPVPKIENAMPSSDLTDYNIIINYTCKIGYRWASNTNAADNETVHVTCILGNWQNNTQQCQLIQCPSLDNQPVSHNGSLTYTNYDNELSVMCNEGYRINRTGPTLFTIRCGEDGKWQGMQNCQKVRCPALPTLLTAISHPSSDLFGDEATYQCFPGTWSSRNIFSFSTTCSAHGVWKPSPQECQDVHCASLMTWTDLQANTTSTVYGAKVNVTCISGKLPPSEDDKNLSALVVECDEQGKWLPFEPYCIIKPQPKTIFNVTEATGANVIGSIAIGVLIIFTAGIIVLDFRKLKLDSNEGLTNIKSICQK